MSVAVDGLVWRVVAVTVAATVVLVCGVIVLFMRADCVVWVVIIISVWVML